MSEHPYSVTTVAHPAHSTKTRYTEKELKDKLPEITQLITALPAGHMDAQPTDNVASIVTMPCHMEMVRILVSSVVQPPSRCEFAPVGGSHWPMFTCPVDRFYRTINKAEILILRRIASPN